MGFRVVAVLIRNLTAEVLTVRLAANLMPTQLARGPVDVPVRVPAAGAVNVSLHLGLDDVAADEVLARSPDVRRWTSNRFGEQRLEIMHV